MRKKNSLKYEYLVCPNNCQNNSSIRYDLLSNIVLNSINKIINKYTYLHNKYSELNKIIIDEFIEKIYINNNEKIVTIKWNLK